MLLYYKKVLLLGVMSFIFISASITELQAASSDDEDADTKPKKKVLRVIHVEEADDENEHSQKQSSKSRDEEPSHDHETRYVVKKRQKASLRESSAEETDQPKKREDTEEPRSRAEYITEFNRYSRPQLYFSPGAPWRIIYFSPNISYQGMVPVHGDTNLCTADKEWCLNLKTKEPSKSCTDFEFLKAVARKCEDVQVLSCIEQAKTSRWAQERWKTPQELMEGIQSVFHSGMELRIREFVDRGGKLPWVPTPPWCMNISPKSCSDLDQFDPITGVNQGGKNFITSAENCHFYEIGNCTSEAIESKWAKKRWGDDMHKIRTEINRFIFEKHLERLTKKFPASMAVSEDEARRAEPFKMSTINTNSSPSFAAQQVHLKR